MCHNSGCLAGIQVYYKFCGCRNNADFEAARSVQMHNTQKVQMHDTQIM